MSEFFSSGRAADVLIMFMALEAVLLIALRNKLGHGLSNAAITRLLVPGLFLTLALRAALTGSAWMLIAGLLFAALLAHLMDLMGRWPKT